MKIYALSALFALFVALLTGCGDSTVQQPEGVRMDITVQNATNQDIFVEVHSGDRHEDFGVVGQGTGATIGFGITPIGHTVTVEWSKEYKGPTQKTTLVLPAPVNDSVILTYQTDGTWTTKPPGASGKEPLGEE